MQVFGKFSTSFDIEYITQQYVYIPLESEVITVDEFENLLKNRRKTVIGTIFFHNPSLSPVGYNNKTLLASQGFEFKDKFYELNFDNSCNLLYSSLKNGYRGKLVEIKYLFNLNRENIENTIIMEDFETDLDRYSSNQLTRYDRELNYHDYLNIRLSGKFVFFATGVKFEKNHRNIVIYIANLASQAAKLGKDISFIHDNNYSAQECIESAYFLTPLALGKLKDIRANAFKKAFTTNPPTIMKIR